jgi:glyoxylase-like metal-dependent hydrolase (beta-lactamase superfamily II)
MADLTPGVASALSPLVRRVVAPNPGLMTGPGTNTYLVGIDEVAVIDPGPDDPGHVEAIIGASMSERVRWVLLTHTHPDHWPAAASIARRTGAEIAGFAKFPKADEVTLKLDRVLDEGDVVEGTEFGLEVLHTPGHAPNHLCFLLEEERVLFSGDHVLDGTTTVISPQRGGDMAEYLKSLERLRKLRRIARICPAHGDVIEDPQARLDEYMKHRRMRERQIVKTLGDGPTKISDIVARLYTDTPEGLLEMAGRQVHAHLLKLRAEGKVVGTGARSAWKLA